MWQDLSRGLRKRDKVKENCESSNEDGGEGDNKKPKKSNSKCSSLSPPLPEVATQPPESAPGPTGTSLATSRLSEVPTQPLVLPLQPPSTSLANELPQTILPISVSAFPAMATGAAMTNSVFIVATAMTTGAAMTTSIEIAAKPTTLSSNTPTMTPSPLPSGTRKLGDSPQSIKASSHPKLSPHAKTALIACGVIIAIALLGFLIFTTLRRLKRKRSEASAYGDLETLYRSEQAPLPSPPLISESPIIATPPEACIAASPSSPVFRLPPIFRTSHGPWSGSLYRHSGIWQVEEDPFADQPRSESVGLVLPSPIVVRKEVKRKQVGGGGGVREDPFRDPDKRGEVEEMIASTMRGFMSTPSWMDDQAGRVGAAR